MTGVSGQPLVFSACVGAGVIAALLYKALGIVRVKYPQKWVDVLCDVLFVMASGALFFVALYYTDDGQVRLYGVLAFLGGFGFLSGLAAWLSRRIRRKKGAHSAASDKGVPRA